MSNKTDYSLFWKNRLHRAFMRQFYQQPCAICRDTFGTCGHHLLEVSHYGLLRFDPDLIVPLCFEHHSFSTHIAPHSRRQEARDRFIEWLSTTRPTQYDYMQSCKDGYNDLLKSAIRLNYKEIYHKLTGER